MQATITLQEITKLDSTIDLANLELTLEDKKLQSFGFNGKITFFMSSTGMSLRVTSEHSTLELMKLCEWLNEASSDEYNLRDNDSELKLFAKEMIKTNKKLNQAKTL